MNAWIAQKVEGGFVVNCIDDQGEVCLYLGNLKPYIAQKEEADALVEKCNIQEIEKMVAAHKERVAQLAAYETQDDSSYIPVSFQE